VRRLADDLYPKAEKIRLVVDNLNIHSAASFYEVFDAERARELGRRIEFRYTPVHGSWLNMAETEISVLLRACANRLVTFRTWRLCGRLNCPLFSCWHIW
jgi:DDE superfamily endonuclease